MPRSQRNRLEMKRTSSEGKALDYDEPVKENAKHDGYKYTKAKTHVSGSCDCHVIHSIDKGLQVFLSV